MRKNRSEPLARLLSSAPRRGVLLFLFWTVHGPFSFFLLEEKEKMGGCKGPAIFMAETSPARKGE